MYDIIDQMIGHNFSSYNSLETAIGYACICLIIIFCVATVDLISQFVKNIFRFKK